MIVKKKDGYHVLSKKTKRNLGGPYKTRKEALKRLRQVEFFKHQKGFAQIFITIAIGLVVAFAVGVFFANSNVDKLKEDVSNTVSSITQTSKVLDLTKLPLGDGKYSSSPKIGYVYSCQTQFNGGGASGPWPWVDETNKTWDLTQKVQVDGDVSWRSANFVTTVENGKRTFTWNDLPVSHTTGVYPISSKDDAYQIDRNPNSIKAQNLSLELPINPVLASAPQCVGGEVGIMLSGVLIFNAFDAGGRDAVATEVQDHCQGHPQEAGFYHYHGFSSCLEDESSKSEHSSILGYAFDGFGIYGLKGEDGVELTAADLDACHGHSHIVNWDGEEQEMYHYHLTRDFPYSVGCFMGEAVVKGLTGQGGQQPPNPKLPPLPGLRR